MSPTVFDSLRNASLALGAGAIMGLVTPAWMTPPRAPLPTFRTLPADSQLGGELPDYSRKSEAPEAAETRTTHFAVTFWHIHTRQLLPVAVEDPPTETDIARFLRCRVTGDQTPMSPAPFETAIALAQHFERRRVHVVSGFRSPKFNEQLRKKAHQVARSSYHMSGHALDFRIPGVPTAALANLLDETHDGGVGRYRQSGFVHVDDGPRRRWRGR